MDFKIGDFVKVIEQDIWGKVVEVNPYAIVIDDEDSEWEYPDSRLEFRRHELQLINPED